MPCKSASCSVALRTCPPQRNCLLPPMWQSEEQNCSFNRHVSIVISLSTDDRERDEFQRYFLHQRTMTDHQIATWLEQMLGTFINYFFQAQSDWKAPLVYPARLLLFCFALSVIATQTACQCFISTHDFKVLIHQICLSSSVVHIDSLIFKLSVQVTVIVWSNFDADIHYFDIKTLLFLINHLQ